MKSAGLLIAAACAVVATVVVLGLRDDGASADAPMDTVPAPGASTRTANDVHATAASSPSAGATRGEVVTEPTPRPESADRRTLSGRVVDERRFPVPGATVELRKNDVVVETTSSDAAGHFALAAADAQLDGGVLIVARAGAEHFATKRWFASYGLDIGTLVLAKASVLRVVVTRDGAPVAGAAIIVDVGKYRHAMFTARTDAEGRATIEGVPDGFTWVRAEHETGMGRKRAFLPDESNAEIALVPANTFEVWVVEKGTATPVAAAKLTLSEGFWIPSHREPDENWTIGDAMASRELPGRAGVTDSDGKARFERLDPEGSFEVGVLADGFERSSARLKLSPTPQIIELTPNPRRNVRVPVIADELPVPPEGTVLTLRFAPGSRDTRTAPGPLSMGRGEFVIPAWTGDGGFVATTPDGGLANVWIEEGKDVARAAMFVKTRSIAVHAVDANGRPVAGARARAFNQGNNPLGEATTDVDGRAILRDLLPGLVKVRVASPTDVGQGADAGSVDLKAGDASVECVLPLALTALLQVRIDGRAALPAVFRVTTAAVNLGFGGGPAAPRVLEEFPERGELRVVFEVAASELGKTLRIKLDGSGDLSGTAEFVPAQGGAEPVVQLDLVRASRLDVVVTRPPNLRVKIGIEKRDPATGAFARTTSSVPGSISVPNGPADTFRFGGLGPGVYRAIDEESKLASPDVVVPDGANASVAFTIRERTKVTGTVLFPEGTELRLIRVIAEAQGLVESSVWRIAETFPDGVHVDKNGAFDITIPGDREVVVRPWHPWLQPAEPGGRLTTKAGATGVVLALATGQEIRLPVPDLTGPRFEQKRGFMGVIPRVAYWRGAITGAPERWLPAPLVDGELRFGGLEPGTYSLLVDATTDFAPLELADVVVAAGATRLPAATFKKGAAVRVRILTAAGFDPPRIYVTAKRTGEPSYVRALNSNGDAEVVLPGLGPGEFRITAAPISDRNKSLDRVVVCDGLNDVSLELDLR